MHICIRMYIYVYIYIYAYTHTYIYKYTYIQACTSMYIYVCMHIYMYIYVYICMYKYVHIYIYIKDTHILTHTHTLAHTYAHTHTNKHTHTHRKREREGCAHTHWHVFVYVYTCCWSFTLRRECVCIRRHVCALESKTVEKHKHWKITLTSWASSRASGSLPWCALCSVAFIPQIIHRSDFAFFAKKLFGAVFWFKVRSLLKPPSDTSRRYALQVYKTWKWRCGDRYRGTWYRPSFASSDMSVFSAPVGSDHDHKQGDQ